MKRYWLSSLLVGILFACGGKPGSDGSDTGGPDLSEVDKDGDGSTADVDCDDSDSTSYPGADELCDGLDNDCDSEVDEDQFEMFLDSDGDGFGDDATSVMDCELRPGHVETAGDCDDSNTAVYPGAQEVCDGVDNDCDATTSELGLVEQIAPDGTVTDVSDWFAGNSSSAAQVNLSSPGERYSFCEGTYYAHIDITASGITLEGQVGKA
ncbi:MAG: putative metal-binding motif-containing protein, partial [Myxococcota bacterium]|nr:putative metal-binding motif-containing protein [Myxococcota bacterium]